MEEENNVDEKVLMTCHGIFRKFLDVDLIFPYLGRNNLLTQCDREVLSNQYFTRTRKIDHLVEILPRKGGGWFEIFINTLQESAEGTGSAHTDLIRALRREKAKLERVIPPTAQDDQYKPSRISNTTSWIAEKSSLNHLQALAGSAFPATPPALRKRVANQEDLVHTLERKQKALKHHIKLVHLNEQLIEHMKTFRDTLITVQSYYVSTFRNYDKVNRLSLLSEAQLQMARIIESLTGCDENFDLIKEIEEWDKNLQLMQESCTEIKDVLYSLDDRQIKQQQIELKLDGQNKDAAEEWIRGRESVVENGTICFQELTKLIDQNVAKESDLKLIEDVKKRIEAGKECLQLWKNWVELRASL